MERLFQAQILRKTGQGCFFYEIKTVLETVKVYLGFFGVFFFFVLCFFVFIENFLSFLGGFNIFTPSQCAEGMFCVPSFSPRRKGLFAEEAKVFLVFSTLNILD